jgi:hypothetical protein
MAKTLMNLYSQLQQWLEGEAIPIGNIPKMDIPPNFFFDGNFVQSLGKATKECCPTDISFWYGVDFFLH